MATYELTTTLSEAVSKIESLGIILDDSDKQMFIDSINLIGGDSVIDVVINDDDLAFTFTIEEDTLTKLYEQFLDLAIKDGFTIAPIDGGIIVRKVRKQDVSTSDQTDGPEQQGDETPHEPKRSFRQQQKPDAPIESNKLLNIAIIGGVLLTGFVIYKVVRKLVC